MVWLACAAAFAWVVVALASFRADDWPTHVVAMPNDPPLNLCGRFGAAVAYWIYSNIGYGVWIPLAYLGTVLGFAAAGRAVTHPFVRFVGCLVAMLAFGGLHAEWFPTVGPLSGTDAGLAPMWFADELHVRFGPVGASLVFLVAFLVGAIVSADALVFMIPAALAQAFGFLSPLWETDWKGHFASLRERFSAMFPQPATATAGRGGRARKSAARPKVGVATADEDELAAGVEDELEDEATDESEDDSEDGVEDGVEDAEEDDAELEDELEDEL